MWKIAIVDDDRQVLKGLKSQIPWEELNAECVGEAMDGSQGLGIVHANKPDIIITDIYMPEMNGLEMIQTLRHEGYEGKIIIHSGYNDFEYARQALRLNVDDYLSKPISLQTLRNVLAKAIQELVEDSRKKWEQSEMQKKIMLYEPFVSKEWLKGVLTGALDSSYQNSLWLEYCDKRQNVRYVVLGIELSELNRFSEVTISDWRLLRYAVSNIIQEVVPEYATEFDYVELYCSHSVVVLYFNKDKAEHDISATLRKLAERIIFCVQNVLNLGLRIGIGTMKEQWEQLSDSTEEAFHALTNCEYANCQQVDVYEYKASLGGKRLEGPYVRLVKCYQQLSEAIKASQEEHANQIIEAFMRQLEEQGVLTPSFLRRFGMECWTILTYALHEVGIALDDMIPQEHIHTELNSIMRPEQFRGWIADKISIICRNRNFNENTKHKQAVDFIIQYIQKHYHEEITLTELAEKVFISRNYLCDIFKKATGETFHGYLTRVRMEKAKQLVMEGKLHVYEIAQRVGYKNVPYFSTVFKKYFSGISPTEMIK